MTTLHFANARLIDPEAGTDATGSLTVQDGLILSRDEKAPKGAALVDCGGKCLAPGIVAFLVSADLPTDSVEAFLSVDDALVALRASEARGAEGGPA